MNRLKKSGFTLIELLIVISIISVTSAGSYLAYTNIVGQARAQKVLDDFQKTAAAWKLWHLDNGPYPPQTIYFNPKAGANDNVCGNNVGIDEPLISMTDLPVLRSGTSPTTWKGPYLKVAPRDPFGHEYVYDNDSNVFPTNGLNAGVNIVMHYCSTSSIYKDLETRLDKMKDNSDGLTKGTIRSDGGNLYYMISRQSSE